MTSSQINNRADHLYYRVYWKLMLEDLCHKLDMDATKENKERLHEFHKKILGYETIAGKSRDYVSLFLFEVALYWAQERGIFVRTNRHQPTDIQYRSFFDIVHLDNGEVKRIIDLL